MTLIASRLRDWSLARQILVLQIVVVGITVIGHAIPAGMHTRQLMLDDAAQTTAAVAISIANSPAVLSALSSRDPSPPLQPYAERVRREAGLDFIVIMSKEGRRYTHPNPQQIGGRFIGTIAPAQAGRTFTEIYTGTLGPSVRAVTPVRDATGQVVALVSTGITIEKIHLRVSQNRLSAIIIGMIALAVGTVGAYLVGVRLRRQTHGLRSAELSRMYEYHQAILHAVREGLMLIDRDGRLILVNDGARELLTLPPDSEGRLVTELGLPQSLAELLASGENRSDEIHLTDTRVLVVTTTTVRSGARTLGTVATVRDHTDLQAYAGLLNAERGFAESLRSAAHEAANRLHTVVSLIELGRTDQAVAFATAELEVAQQLTDRVVAAVREPVIAALLLGKTAEAAERGVELVISPDSELDDVALDSRDLVTILGNLIDNAVEAAMSGNPPAQVRVELCARDGVFRIEVADSGPGLDARAVTDAFQRGWTSKGDGRGLGLALVGQAVRRLGGHIAVDPGGGASGGAVFTVRLPLAQAADHHTSWGTDDDNRPGDAGTDGQPEGRTAR